MDGDGFRLYCCLWLSAFAGMSRAVQTWNCFGTRQKEQLHNCGGPAEELGVQLLAARVALDYGAVIGLIALGLIGLVGRLIAGGAAQFRLLFFLAVFL